MHTTSGISGAPEYLHYREARHAFVGWLSLPEQDTLRSVDLDAGPLSPTARLTVFLAGAAYLQFGSAARNAEIANESARAACEDWLANGKHSSLVEPQAADKERTPEAYGERSFDEEIRVHELFALFRAGTRYAKTGNPFRIGTDWSVPAP
jgi:hypothetical protein